MGLSDLLGLTSSASWRDGYITGSFRGVEFFTERATMSGGRKLVQHNFPERDDAYNEDLGRQNNTFSFSAYVLGDEYYNHRGDLEDALNKKGSGVLIHPYRGEILVQVESFTISESIDEGRMCRFDISFVRDEDIALTIVGPGPYDLLGDAVADFLATSLTYMDTAFDIANTPNAVLADLQAIINTGMIITNSAKPIMNTDDVFQKNLGNFQDSISTLFATPSLLVSEMQELIYYGTDTSNILFSDYVTGEAGFEMYSGLSSLTAFQDVSYSEFPTITDVDGQPAREIAKFISRTALASRVGLVATMEIESVNQADDILADLGALITTVEEDALIDDDMFAAARDLRVNLKSMIAQRKLDLGVLVQIEIPEFIPAIALAYDLYQDPSRDEEIAELNDVLHPGFIPAGTVTVIEE